MPAIADFSQSLLLIAYVVGVGGLVIVIGLLCVSLAYIIKFVNFERSYVEDPSLSHSLRGLIFSTRNLNGIFLRERALVFSGAALIVFAFDALLFLLIRQSDSGSGIGLFELSVIGAGLLVLLFNTYIAASSRRTAVRARDLDLRKELADEQQRLTDLLSRKTEL